MGRGKPLPSYVMERHLRARDGDDCRICHSPLGTNPSIDHIVPKAHGGTWHPDNLALTHLDCNMAKGIRSPKPHLRPPGKAFTEPPRSAWARLLDSDEMPYLHRRSMVQ